MGWRFVLSLLFIIFVILLLTLYWFIPISTTEFTLTSGPSNFSIPSVKVKQFYNNMRFPEKRISYNIGHCPLQKKDDMLRAFEILENESILDFYEASSNEDITIVCDSSAKIEEGLFIAGEGGPTNITRSGEFNVITHGRILLFRESMCFTPNVALHELLHVLGFDHSENSNDIMYPVSKCGQSINPSVIETLDTLYSIPSYPDLAFERVSAIMHGKYLDVNISLRNNGFQRSPMTIITIYAGDDVIKEIDLESLEIGHGRIISLVNLWVPKISVDRLRFVIKSDFDELKKENNEVFLKTKK